MKTSDQSAPSVFTAILVRLLFLNMLDEMEINANTVTEVSALKFHPLESMNKQHRSLAKQSCFQEQVVTRPCKSRAASFHGSTLEDGLFYFFPMRNLQSILYITFKFSELMLFS